MSLLYRYTSPFGSRAIVTHLPGRIHSDPRSRVDISGINGASMDFTSRLMKYRCGLSVRHGRRVQ